MIIPFDITVHCGEKDRHLRFLVGTKALGGAYKKRAASNQSTLLFDFLIDPILATSALTNIPGL